MIKVSQQLTGGALLTPEQTAPLLGVSIGTLSVWRSTRRYRLPYLKVGRLVRYRSEDIQDWLLDRQVPVHPQQQSAEQCQGVAK